jgi:glycosyltransferase involved in cell wall biosynthesis
VTDDKRHRRLRVAFLIPALSGGGAERATATIARYLDAKDFDPILVIQRSGAGIYRAGDNVRTATLGVARTRDAVRPLIKFLNEWQPDVLYAGLPHLCLLAAFACKIARHQPRLVLAVHNNQKRELDTARHGRLMRRLMPWAYRSADAVVAVSLGVAKELGSMNDDPSKVQVLYNPVAIDEVKAMANLDVSHPWLDSGHDVIVGMGRLTPQKGFQFLIEAFVQIAHQRPRARLMIFGEGEEAASLKQLVAERGVARSVEFGFQANPFAYLARSKCFVLSSLWEGFGMSIVEAMASGAPVVSVDCPYGPAEILGGGRYGVMTKVGSADDLAAAILRVLDDGELRLRMVRDGMKRALDFDAPVIVGRYADLLQDVVDHAGRHPGHRA